MADVTDIASNYEAVEREAHIANARRPVNAVIAGKRRALAEARILAEQRGPSDPELQQLDLECENQCGELLTVENEDIFCCKECAEDWQRRDRARIISGR
jgi:hypothetical protein